MRIAVDMGHCPKSTGANGYLNELTETRRIGAALIAELKARGHEVIDVTPADSEAESLSGRARRANAAKADFFASIHLNAGGGTGVEVYTTHNSGAIDEAKATSAALAEVLGLKNRGHKTARFTVLVKTSMPAMLVETCFVDTAKDAEAYRACSVEKIAAAIAGGILGGSKTPVSGGAGSGSAKVETPSQKTVEQLASEVIAGEWGNGSVRKQRLTEAGYDYAAVQAAVNAKLSGSKTSSKKSVDAIAREVIRGEWGNGAERKKRLQAAGYDYATVQRRVNQLI